MIIFDYLGLVLIFYDFLSFFMDYPWLFMIIFDYLGLVLIVYDFLSFFMGYP